jgi:hypothetical protein
MTMKQTMSQKQSDSWLFLFSKLVNKLSDFLLDLHKSLAQQGLAKSLDISIGMPTIFVAE